jgi:polysaccharide biosynthesis protein PslG
MIKRLIGILALAAVIISILPVTSAKAVRGIPGSAEFGFGAFIDINGQYVEDGIQLANNLQLDWVNLEIPWKLIQPTKDSKNDWSLVDQALSEMGGYKIAALASITQPPSWAQTSSGPDANLTSQFVLQVIQKYGNTVTGLELFPAANTRLGWGGNPDPVAYMSLWKAVSKSLNAAKKEVLLVAGGLLPGKASKDTQDDLEYLQGMYQAGAQTVIQVISLQMHNLVGSPADSPTQDEHRYLRHYEQIREVMLKNKHEKGILWITGLGSPSNLATFGESSASVPQKQAAWLSQAFQQIRSQLYIGVAFLDRLNPSAVTSAQKGITALITQTGDLHPIFRVLRDQIAQNSSGNSDPRPGRPKSDNLIKGH